MERLVTYFQSFYGTRVLVSAIQGFKRHDSYLKAARLTYYTLLSLVPVLAVAFGIAKGFGFEHYFEKQLLVKFAEQKEIVNRATEFAHNLLAKTQEGFLVFIGFITFFWFAFQLLGLIEAALNQIWDVKEPRSIGRKITDYMVLLIICPFLFVFSNAAALFIITRIGQLAETTIIGPINPSISFSLQVFLTFIFTWIFFIFIYLVIPNTHIKLKIGIIAGIVGGSLYLILQWLYITFQIGVSNLGAIYGSFAAVPLFLIWVHSSWLIFLFGAEVGYAAENEGVGDMKKKCAANEAEIALLIAAYCIKAFKDGAPPPSLTFLSSRLHIPPVALKKILNELIENKILVEAKGGESYLPAKNIDTITLQSVLKAMDKSRQTTHFAYASPELIQIQKLVKAVDLAAQNSEENITLRDCID